MTSIESVPDSDRTIPRSAASDPAAATSEGRRRSGLQWTATLPIDWGEPRICQVAQIGTGHTPSRSRPELWENCSIPWLTTSDVHRFRNDEITHISSTEYSISEIGLDNSAAVLHPAGTVALSRTASAGFSIVMDADMATSQDFVTWTAGPALHPEYLLWCLRAMRPDLMGRLATGSTHKTIYFPDLMSIRIPLPPLDEQRRIADFLDDQIARIDNIVAAREKQVAALEASRLNVAFTALSGSTGSGDRKDSGLQWLGSIPMAWPMSTVHSAFEVVLGKMLDESRFSGEYAIPYLRNANVQWDHIHVDDLKVMDIPPSEYDRFTVRSGDLLICEGGQPGRSAVWSGDIAPLGFQKALHRARPRGDCDARWLQVFLRVAVGLSVFASEFGQSTISHLTGEQLRSARIPIPPADAQASLCDQVDDGLALIDAAQLGLGRSIDLLVELKRSLITSAVTGEFDVTAADGSQLPA